jgi:hypothetical protein
VEHSVLFEAQVQHAAQVHQFDAQLLLDRRLGNRRLTVPLVQPLAVALYEGTSISQTMPQSNK